MSRRLKLVLPIALLVALLTVGIAPVAMAQAPPSQQSQPEGKSLLARVAEILGGNVTEQRLIDAFKQANLQIRNEAVEKALEKAVSDNRISSTEAGQIRQWWQQRPAALDSLISGFLPRLAPRLRPIVVKDQLTIVAGILSIPEETLVAAFKQAAREMRTDVFSGALDKAVANGRLTQQQADNIREKVKDKPGVINWLWRWGRMHRVWGSR
jgi:hypothetical protein